MKKTTKTNRHIRYQQLCGLLMIVALIVMVALIGFLLPEKHSVQEIPKEKLLLQSVKETNYNPKLDLLGVRLIYGFNYYSMSRYVVSDLPRIAASAVENADTAFIRLETTCSETLVFDANGNAYLVVSDAAFEEIPDTDCLYLKVAMPHN